jgi:hypothetical protein
VRSCAQTGRRLTMLGTRQVIKQMQKKYPKWVSRHPKWMFNNAGGAMGSMAVRQTHIPPHCPGDCCPVPKSVVGISTPAYPAPAPVALVCGRMLWMNSDALASCSYAASPGASRIVFGVRDHLRYRCRHRGRFREVPAPNAATSLATGGGSMPPLFWSNRVSDVGQIEAWRAAGSLRTTGSRSSRGSSGRTWPGACPKRCTSPATSTTSSSGSSSSESLRSAPAAARCYGGRRRAFGGWRARIADAVLHTDTRCLMSAGRLSTPGAILLACCHSALPTRSSVPSTSSRFGRRSKFPHTRC